MSNTEVKVVKMTRKSYTVRASITINTIDHELVALLRALDLGAEKLHLELPHAASLLRNLGLAIEEAYNDMEE